MSRHAKALVLFLCLAVALFAFSGCKSANAPDMTLPMHVWENDDGSVHVMICNEGGEALLEFDVTPFKPEL